MSIAKQTEAEMWKIKALLGERSLYKRKRINAKDLAKKWHITERQAFRHLAEADAIFIDLAHYFLMQPDCTVELVDKQLPLEPRRRGRPKKMTD